MREATMELKRSLLPEPGHLAQDARKQRPAEKPYEVDESLPRSGATCGKHKLQLLNGAVKVPVSHRRYVLIPGEVCPEEGCKTRIFKPNLTLGNLEIKTGYVPTTEENIKAHKMLLAKFFMAAEPEVQAKYQRQMHELGIIGDFKTLTKKDAISLRSAHSSSTTGTTPAMSEPNIVDGKATKFRTTRIFSPNPELGLKVMAAKDTWFVGSYRGKAYLTSFTVGRAMVPVHYKDLPDYIKHNTERMIPGFQSGGKSIGPNSPCPRPSQDHQSPPKSCTEHSPRPKAQREPPISSPNNRKQDHLAHQDQPKRALKCGHCGSRAVNGASSYGKVIYCYRCEGETVDGVPVQYHR
jgi:hypothetical protein